MAALANFERDADKKDKLAAYQAHVAKVLELSGVPAADAATQAKDVLAFETRLAKASKSSEELSRDVSLYYNPVTPADADKLTPNFSWTQFFESQGVATPKMFSLAMPAFHQEVEQDAGRRAGRDVEVATCASTPSTRASPYLSAAVRAGELRVLRQDACAARRNMKARWKRVLDTVEQRAPARRSGQMYVKVAFPPESKARMEKLVQNLRTALKARIENLDWMSPETKKKAMEKWATFTPKIGYPDKWRDWTGLTTSARQLLRQRARRQRVQLQVDDWTRSASRSTRPSGA